MIEFNKNEVAALEASPTALLLLARILRRTASELHRAEPGKGFFDEDVSTLRRRADELREHASLLADNFGDDL